MLLKTFGGRSVTKTAAKQRGGRIQDFDAHSPMFRNRNFNEERRSRLFDDRQFIYGRLPKLLLAWMFCMNFWAGYYIYHRHALTSHLQEKTKKAYRRTVPFVQAMEDVRYVALQERNYMILKAICDYKDERLFHFLRKRYNHDDILVAAVKGSPLRHGYDGRFGVGRYWSVKAFRRPEDEDGLVGFQEVTHM